MNLFSKQKGRLRHRKQTYDYQREVEGGIKQEAGIKQLIPQEPFNCRHCCVSCSVVSDSFAIPVDCSLPGSSVHEIL